MRILIVFLLTHSAFAGELFQSPAAFSNTTCEQYLLGEPGQQKAELAQKWLKGLQPMTLMVQPWTSERDVPDHINPRGVFFDEWPVGTTQEEVAHRFEAAKREADRVSQAPTSSVLRSPDHSEHLLLDEDRLLALGYRTDDDVPAIGLAAHFVVEPGALVFSVVSEERSEGHFRLHANSMTQGFDNIVSTWQATRIDSHTNPPVRAFDTGGEDKILREFMAAHGRFLLTRRISGRTFAYVFDRSMLKRPSDSTSNFDLTIYRVVECDRETAIKVSPIISPRRSNNRYQCFQPLNLRMSVPIEGLSPVITFLSTSQKAL